MAREVYGSSGPAAAAAFPFDRFLDLLLDVLEIDVQVGEHRGGDTLALTNQAEQDVLGADVVVLQPGRLFAGHLQNLANPISEVVRSSGYPT